MFALKAAVFLALRKLGLRPSGGDEIAMCLVIEAIENRKPRRGPLTVIRLRLASSCDPSLVEVWPFLAQALIDRGRRREAAEVLLRALVTSNLGPSDFERFAELFDLCGKDQLRRFCLLASAMEAPHRPDAWSLLGDSYMERRLYHAAHECFLKATRMPKDLMAQHRPRANPQDVRDLGRVQYLLDLDETALRTLERALDMDATDIRTLTYLAQCHRKLGNQDEFDRIVAALRAQREASEDDDWDEDDDEGEAFDWEAELFGNELVQSQRRAALAKLIQDLPDGTPHT